MDKEKRLKSCRLKKGGFKWGDKGRWDQKVDLFSMQPKWPGTYKANLDVDGLMNMLVAAYSLSKPDGCMVLWMPASKLHCSEFDPVTHVPRWKAMGTIFSGTGAMAIGFVYCKTYNSRLQIGAKQLLDTTGTGPSSSITMRWMLEKVFQFGDGLVMRKGLVVDPYAHQSAQLAIWCRRMGLAYRGYMRSKKLFEAANAGLAQIELPGIQEELLTAQSKGKKGIRNEYGKKEGQQ